MRKRMALAVCCILLPSISWAQTTQEKYLPSKSQLYYRWDGMTNHQAGFDKTAAGKMLKGETGEFLREAWKYAQEQIKTITQNDPKIASFIKHAAGVTDSMYHHGLVLGVEVENVTVTAVMVLPKSAGKTGTLLALLDRVAEEGRAKVEKSKIGSRDIRTIQEGPTKLGWWTEGEDGVIYFSSTDHPADYVKMIEAKRTGLANHPLYQKVAGFKEFETCSRGFVDVSSALGVVSVLHPKAGQIIDELGLKGVKHITYVTGFEGLSQRSIVDVEIPGPRKGVLGLISKKNISMKDLPVLPNDITGFNATTLNMSKSYEVLTNVLDGVIQIAAPEQPDYKQHIKAFENKVGVDINKDLFSCFGDVMVTYSSPSDGLLGSGVMAFQLKDGKKLERTLEKLAKAIPPIEQGISINVKKKPYRGGEIVQVQLGLDQGFQKMNMQIASFGIYKNWFVFASSSGPIMPLFMGGLSPSLPQPIKGFILRQEGELPAWKADDALTKVLAQFPSEFHSIHVSDKRATVQMALSMAPLAIKVGNTLATTPGPTFIPGFRPFDLDLIPHAQHATKDLFPNVTISSDNGKRIRTETRASLLLPF